MLNAQPHGQGGKYQIALPLLLSAVIFVLFSASFFNRLLGLGFATAPWLETFASYFIAITLEAVPFILIGALFTAVLETWLPAETLPAITARLGFWGVPATALLAPLFPVCECGVVMVVRGLLRKGLPLPHAVTYLLAAPILNPTVLASTYIAFQDASYPIWRGLGGFAVAVGIGLAFMAMNERRAFRPAFFREINSPQAPPQAVQPLDGLIAPAGHEHSEACGHSHHNHGGGSLRHVAGHIADDFLEMMPYFLFGVLIASTLKTFLSSSLLLPLGEGG